MKDFILRMIVFSLPCIFLIGTYFLFDPFMVLYNYDSFYEDGFVALNRDYVSTEMYLRNRQKYNYNSFIFGSSRTLAFKSDDWKSYLPEDSNPFVFDASGETIYGIWKKILFIDELGDTIQNAMILICGDCTFSRTKNNKGHLFVKHPILSKESQWSFHSSFLSVYIFKGFFIRYIDYMLFHKYRSYMKGYLDPRTVRADEITNDIYLVDWDNDINRNQELYYEKRRNIFYKKDTLNTYYNDKQIYNEHRDILYEINSILNKHKTNYKIVISPLYDQKYFDKEDLNTLYDIFGEKNIYDYSGNNDITNSKYNYYEPGHYRYFVGKKIIQEIYQEQNKNDSIGINKKNGIIY